MAHRETVEKVITGIDEQIAASRLRPEGDNFKPHQEEGLLWVKDWLTREKVAKDPNPGAVQGKLYDSGTLDEATGSGKTWEELALVAGAVKQGLKVVIASPRLHINTQILELAEHPERFGLPPGSVMRFDSDAAPWEKQNVIDGKAPVILTTSAGLRTLDKEGIISPDPKNPNYRGLLVLDESDLFDGFETGRVVRKYRDNSVIFGFSATNFDTNNNLFEGQPPIHTLPIHDTHDPKRGAVKRGLLVNGLKTAVLEVEPDEGDIQKIVDEIRSQREVSEEAAVKYASNQAVIDEVIRFHGSHVDDDLGAIRALPTLIPVPTVAVAKQVSEAFNRAYGISLQVPELKKFIASKAMTAEQRRATYAAIIKAFPQTKDREGLLKNDDSLEKAINQKYGHEAEPVEAFLGEIGKDFDKNHPINTYKVPVKKIAAYAEGNTPSHDVLDRETGDIIDPALKTLIKDFNEGKTDLRVLAYPDVLRRGINMENATVTISMCPFLRPGPVVQDLGRLTRKPTADYEQLFGVPKVASLAVNVQPPNVRPFMFSQVIGGPVLWHTEPPRAGKSHGPTLPAPQMPPIKAKVRAITKFDELNSLYQDAEIAKRERENAIPPGFIEMEDAVKRTGIERKLLNSFVANIDRNGRYTSFGLPPGARGGDPEGTPTMRGDELRKNVGGRSVVHEAMVERWRLRMEEIRAAQENEGAVSEREIAAKHEVSVGEVRKAARRDLGKERRATEDHQTKVRNRQALGKGTRGGRNE